MTDERDKSSRAKESVARVTARDVPFVRGADDESEPAPRGQRPENLPRDPTYEAELAQVELAVMRNPARRDDPSTKQGGGRRAHEFVAGQPPESITPESPGTRSRPLDSRARSPEPPSSSGRAVASGTLLSVGAVDPRGKTERTLETPRMFFSQADEGAEAYFKPGKIPAVTVHQTLETETVKLSDSVDPRRAKTIPRMDPAELARLAEGWGEPDSAAPVVRSEAAPDYDAESSAGARAWNQDYEPASSLGERDHDGQIHASLSPFREQAEPNYSLDGVSTRPEPYVARQASDPPQVPSVPDPSVIPTQRDLPQHRIEASRPPPAPAQPAASRRAQADSAVPASEGVSPTTASIAAEAPAQRSPWANYAAFSAALLLAVALGWWLTSSSETPPAGPDTAKSVAQPVAPTEPPARPTTAAMTATPTPPVPADATAAPVEPSAPRATNTAAPVAPAPAQRPASVPQPSKVTTSSIAPAAPTTAAPQKPTPPKPRETIF
jgi:hypothetical protein